MAPPTQWTWVSVSSGSWWWTGKLVVLQSMGSQSQTWLSARSELNRRVQGSGWRDGLGGSPTPRWCCMQGHAQLSVKSLFLLQALQKFQLDFLVSFYLLCPEFAPTTACMHLFLVPYSFFILCCSWRGVSRCKRCSRRSHVPDLYLSVRRRRGREEGEKWLPKTVTSALICTCLLVLYGIWVNYPQSALTSTWLASLVSLHTPLYVNLII